MTSSASPSKQLSAAGLARVSVARVAVVGPPGSGCSALVRRFVSDSFEAAGEREASEARGAGEALGARFASKMLATPQHGLLRFQLWDVPGGDELLLPVYAAGASVVLVCFDLARPRTLGAAALLLRAAPPGPLLALVGCKADLLGPEQQLDEAAALAVSAGCAFFAATSAADPARGSPVLALFVAAATARARPPPWVPDAERPACAACARPFALLLRRHHCRCCGNVFCAACSPARRPVPRHGFLLPVRVCVDCSDLLDANP